MSKWKEHGPEFKAKVALEALKGEETAAYLTSKQASKQASEPCFCYTKTLADVRFAHIGTGVFASLALPLVRLLVGNGSAI